MKQKIKDMRRKTIKLTEGTLKGIIRNSVMRVLRESFEDAQNEPYDNFEEFGEDDIETMEHLDEEEIAGIQATVDHLNELCETLDNEGEVYNHLQNAVDELQEVLDQYDGTF